MSKSISQLTDSELIEVAHQVVTAMSVDPGGYGTSIGGLAAVTAAATTFETDVTNAVNAAAASKSANGTKDLSRVPVENLIRTQRDGARLVGATDAMMAATGIPSGSSAGTTEATIPLVSVDTSVRLRHELSWRDNGTPTSKARPGNATMVQIYCKLGGPVPVGPSECSFVATDTASPYLVEYDDSHGNQTAHYMLRWQLKNGSLSGWSETVSATIPA